MGDSDYSLSALAAVHEAAMKCLSELAMLRTASAPGAKWHKAGPSWAKNLLSKVAGNTSADTANKCIVMIRMPLRSLRHALDSVVPPDTAVSRACETLTTAAGSPVSYGGVFGASHHEVVFGIAKRIFQRLSSLRFGPVVAEMPYHPIDAAKAIDELEVGNVFAATSAIRKVLTPVDTDELAAFVKTEYAAAVRDEEADRDEAELRRLVADPLMPPEAAAPMTLVAALGELVRLRSSASSGRTSSPAALRVAVRSVEAKRAEIARLITALPGFFEPPWRMAIGHAVVECAGAMCDAAGVNLAGGPPDLQHLDALARAIGEIYRARAELSTYALAVWPHFAVPAAHTCALPKGSDDCAPIDWDALRKGYLARFIRSTPEELAKAWDRTRSIVESLLKVGIAPRTVCERIVDPSRWIEAEDCKLPEPAVEQGGQPASGAVLSLESRALALAIEHPDWSPTRFAKALGCNRTSLYRLEKFQAALALAKAQGKAAMPKGMKPTEQAIDAWNADNE